MVIQRDKRYRIFDHIPDIREQWLRVGLSTVNIEADNFLKDYLDNLEAAQGNQTIHHVN